MRTKLGLAATVLLVAACSSATPTTAPVGAPAAPTPTPEVTAAPTPTPEVTAEPTEEVTPEPEPLAEPISLAEITEAGEDCDAILAAVNEERIKATTDPAVLVVALDMVSRCLTGEYIAPPAAAVSRGTVARVGGWDVKITGKVNFNAWKVVKRENMFNDPAPKGWSMVLVPLQVWNRSAEKANLLGEMGYVVGNSTGVEYHDFNDPTCGVIPKELDAFTDIRPGGTLKGNMCFAVQNADLKTLRMGWPAGMFSDAPDVEFSLR